MFFLIIKSGASVVRPGIYSAYRLNVFFFFLFYLQILIILHFFSMFRYIFSSVMSSFLSWSLIQMKHRRHCFQGCLALWAAYSSFVGLQYDYRFISFWAESLWRLNMWSNSELSVQQCSSDFTGMAPFCKQYWRLNPGSLTWKARALSRSCFPNFHICTFEVSFPKTPSTHH